MKEKITHLLSLSVQILRTHAKKAILVALVLVGGTWYAVHGAGAATETRYVLAKAARGTLTSVISGSGQVSSTDQADAETEVSGTITYVNVSLGQKVSQGQVIAYIDSSDAQRSVSNAELSLENANISYEKALKQSQDQAAGSSLSDLNRAYEDAYSSLAKVMVDTPDIIEDMNNIFYLKDNSPYFNDDFLRVHGNQTTIDYKYEAGVTFDKVVNDYEDLFRAYRGVSSKSEEKLIPVLSEAKDLLERLHGATLETYNTLDYLKARLPADEVPSELTRDKNTLSADLNTLDSRIDALSSALTDIEDAKGSSTEATLDLKTAQLKVSEAEDALKEAREDLAHHTIVSPFAGTIAVLPVKARDKVSSGATIATLVTEQKVAELSLNEVDAAKVKLGQEAALTLDALEDVTLKGSVIETDLIGSVSQGVVSYKVKIGFDSKDERIKPGMTINADITTSNKENVILVPLAAVETAGNKSFIQIAPGDAANSRAPGGVALTTLPTRREVTTGESNDEFIEILSGLEEGETYVARTVAGSVTSASPARASQQNTFFGAGAGTGATRSLNGGTRTFAR